MKLNGETRERRSPSSADPKLHQTQWEEEGPGLLFLEMRIKERLSLANTQAPIALVLGLGG